MKKQPPESPVLKVVKAVKPVNDKGQIDRFGNQQNGNFGIANYCLVKFHEVKDKGQNKTVSTTAVEIHLFMNGCALIDYEIVSDDGVAENRFFAIVGKLTTGLELPSIKVPISKFPSMAWPLDYWGNKLIIAPGNGNKDNARAAIQLLSGDVPTVYEYRHTGWRQIDGEWHYLTGSGAITADGLNDQIRVDLDPGHMQRYCLPPPSDDTQHHAKLLLDLLDISPKNPAIGAALVCAVCRAPLGEAQEIDFSLFFVGKTQSLKSSVAALGLGFFGDFVEVGKAGRFPGNFQGSALDLNIKAHQAKDVLFVVDEFNPNSHQRKKADELHGTLETLCRSAGNRDGRGTRTADHTARIGRYPRGLVLCTGEDMPQSQSLLGRMLVAEFKRGDIDTATLTRHQQDSKAGKHRQGMAAFVQWLAPRMAELKTSFPQKVQAIVEEANKGAHHGGFPNADLRHIGTYASLMAGFGIFIDFLQDAELIGDTQANQRYEQASESLKSLIRSQREYQEQNDEVNVFKELLQACFLSGQVHVGNHLTQGPPKIRPHQWGWRANEEGGDLFARGEAIGWINETKQQIWLDKTATFKAIQKLATSQNEAFTMRKTTLWKRLLEKNILLEPEFDQSTGRHRADVYRAVDGSRKRVLIFPTSFITNTMQGDEA